MARKKTSEAAAAAAAAAAPAPPAPLGPPPPVGEFEVVEIGRICLSRTNPRKYFDPAKMTELRASVREHGVIVPLVVRPHADDVPGRDLELVAGERRLTAASDEGFDRVPVVIKNLTDEQAFDVQLLENGQRADIHPLEEADAFAHKRDRFHRSIEEIAQQTGKTPLYITTRLKLTELCREARQAFLEGKVASAAIALLIARIPDDKLQREALKEIASYNGGEGMPYRQARDHVQRSFMLELGKAPFSIARADLVPEAGACTTCPKRTGNQRELFEDVESKDVCTDPACYRDKVDAEWKLRVAAAKEQDIEVMSAGDAKKLLPYEHASLTAYSNDYVDLDRECYDDTAPRKRTFRQLLVGKGKDKKPVRPDVLIRHPHTGAIIEAVKKKGLERRLRDAGHDFKAERKARQSETQGIVDQDTKKWQEERARQQRERAIDNKLGALVLEEASTAVRGMARESFDFWKLMVQLAVMGVEDFHDFHEEGFFKRHGIEIDADKDDEKAVILAHVATLGSASTVRGFAFELLAGAIPKWGMGRDKLRELLVGHFELDAKELKKRATAAVKEEEKAAKASPKKGGKKKGAPDVDDLDEGDEE